MNKSSLLVFGLYLCVATAAEGRPSAGDRDYYGPIIISDQDAPVLVHERPIVVHGHARREPLYLRVPPGHSKHWEKHCAKYKACDRPVYFVDDKWYHDRYRTPHEQR